MKQILKIVAIFILSLLCTSCSINTVNGEWVTQKDSNGEYTLLSTPKDPNFELYRMINDSTYKSKILGTYVNQSDTITFFSSEKGVQKYTIKVLNEDDLTLVNEKGRVMMFKRKYHDTSNEYAELIGYKYGAFWGEIWINKYLIILGLIMGLIIDVLFIRKEGKN